MAENACGQLHARVRHLETYPFPAQKELLPGNGVYFLFEKGEHGHGGPRIVRIGSHTGVGNLPSRMKEHTTKNKDRSIFRKNIGRALLHKAGDIFLQQWNWDLTKRENRHHYAPLLDSARQEVIETEVSQYFVDNLTFAVVRIDDQTARLNFEKHAIATVAQCAQCCPSEVWLGNSSPIESIRKSGLWLKQHLRGEVLASEEFKWLD